MSNERKETSVDFIFFSVEIRPRIQNDRIKECSSLRIQNICSEIKSISEMQKYIYNPTVILSSY